MLISGKKRQHFLAIVVAFFGGMTITSAGAVLSTNTGATLAGDAVPFVVWFNFLAGFFYIAAALGVWRGAYWGVFLPAGLFLAYLIMDGFLFQHILSGGAYESRTVYAMAFRTVLWLFITVTTYRHAQRSTLSA